MKLSVSSCATSFSTHLEGEGKSKRTVQSYVGSVRSFASWAGDPDIAEVDRDMVVSYLQHERATHKANTAHSRFKGLHVFFAWALEEGEIAEDPMRGLKSQKPRLAPPTVLKRADVLKLLDACRGINFVDRRDAAIMRVMLDSGVRLSECVGMQLEDVDMEGGIVFVRKAKGDARRVVPMGAKAKQALDRYLRARARHKYASRRELWLSERGALSRNGMYETIKKRGRKAGVPVNPHLFRHTFSHIFRASGGGVDDLMEIMGWTSVEMALRYGKSAAQERAINTHRRLGIGDGF